MRWLLLLLVVLVLGCAETKVSDAPAVNPVPQELTPPSEPPTEVPKEQEVQKVEGLSVRELLPSTVMDYSNFTFHCATGFCSGLYRSRQLGNANTVQVEFHEKLDPASICNAGIRALEFNTGRNLTWCTAANTKELFSSHLWWNEPGLGYVSIISEERTLSFSNSTRLKNSDFAANSTSRYIISRLDYFASTGKKIVIPEA